MKNKTSIVKWGFIGVGILMAAAVWVISYFTDEHHINLSATAWANRLRQIDAAKNEWALEFSKRTNDVPTWTDLTPYIYRPSVMFSNFTYANGSFSRTGEVYTIGRVDEPPTCCRDGKILKLP